MVAHHGPIKMDVCLTSPTTDHCFVYYKILCGILQCNDITLDLITKSREPLADPGGATNVQPLRVLILSF